MAYFNEHVSVMVSPCLLYRRCVHRLQHDILLSSIANLPIRRRCAHRLYNIFV